MGADFGRRYSDHTGAAKYLAAQILPVVGTNEPCWLLTAFFALTVFLTQPVSGFE